ncbi:protein phosphatase 1 regulatory subunit 14C isoform X2 [Tursiops truncatus]|uniref:Protein phosphatase 1 regulatory subunit 14 n=1 Tax=Tursiops truncatus TaxID=9739 RepID=A0A2U4CPR1_TURTR|nr:protein phosphatase 1 regulatory subunit 14C isoform X2 [Tursiops truncatus]XP_019807337.1 protein phosphatase 1 regulatory subunit 14C isoform X2 [Tursiops truncatus]
MSVATGSSEAAAGAAGGGGARVFFQSPRGGAGGSPGSSSGSGSSREDSAPVATASAAGHVQQQQQRRHQQGKVTVKYDRKELRKRLVLEEWIVEQLGQLYGCEEEEMPDVEIDIDDLLDADSEEERALKLREALVDCYKPTEVKATDLDAGDAHIYVFSHELRPEVTFI